MNYGTLYDRQVADTYDRDELRLLSGVRALALAQVRATALPDDAMVVDLGAGTGESLLYLRDRFPGGRFIGVDLSERMLAIAREKVQVQTFTDDALNANAHVADGSADLVLAHFLTSFVNRLQLFRVARRAVRAGGAISVASTTREAMLQLRQGVAALLGDDVVVDAAAPAPPNDGTIAAELEACGFEVVAFDTFRKAISFATFDECLDWGLQSGFLTQAVDAIGIDRIHALRPLTAAFFPLQDEYVGVAVTANAVNRR